MTTLGSAASPTLGKAQGPLVVVNETARPTTGAAHDPQTRSNAKGRPRKFDHDQARRLHQQGVSLAELGRTFGVTYQAVYYATKGR